MILVLDFPEVCKDPINDILVLVQIMAWRRRDDNQFSEPMMVRLNWCIYAAHSSSELGCFLEYVQGGQRIDSHLAVIDDDILILTQCW